MCRHMSISGLHLIRRPQADALAAGDLAQDVVHHIKVRPQLQSSCITIPFQRLLNVILSHFPDPLVVRLQNIYLNVVPASRVLHVRLPCQTKVDLGSLRRT